MLRKRRLPPMLNLELHEGGILQTQQISPPQIQDNNKYNQIDEIDENKRFLNQILKFTKSSVKLPDYITNRTIEQSLRAFNVRLASIASSKQILADYEKHFQALNVFFQRIIGQGKPLPADEQVIWRMFFTNNIAIIAFNNGDYTTSLSFLRQITNEYNKKQYKQPIFSLAITNLSAIYYKMDSKVKCFEYLQIAYQYSKKLVDSIQLQAETDNQKQLNWVLAIQCIMMVKNRKSIETSKHNIDQIEKLIIKLVKEGNKDQPGMNIPFINKYLQQKKFSQLQQIQQRAVSQLSSRRGRMKNYRLDSISIDHNINVQTRLSQQTISQQTQFDSPVKKYSFNKIKLEIDALNYKVTRLELKTNKIESSVSEILDILKNKGKRQLLSPLKQKSLASNIQSDLRVVNKQPSKNIFKTLQIFITFYDQGMKLKTFTGEQEKLSWGELQNIFKLVDLLHIYFKYLQLNPTRHTIAWLISKYVTIQNGIKIKKQPNHILTFNHSGNKYGLYHVRQKQFTIYGSDIQAVIFQMSQKAFNYYFEILKIDQYESDCISYFSDEPPKKRQDYFLQVIQVKSNGTFQQDIFEVFVNFKTILKSTSNILSSFKKVKLWFDQTTDACCFIGAYYHLFQNNDLSVIQIKIYPLNNYEGIQITNPILKIFSFNDLQTRYSFSLNQISRLNLLNLYINLVEFVSIRIQIVKRNGKPQTVIHSTNIYPDYYYFQQRMILKKYYRPLSIWVLKTQNKYLNMRFSYYNEAQLLTSNITVMLNSSIDKKSSDNTKQTINKFEKIKQKVKTQFLSKQFGIMQSRAQTSNFIHIQQFINMIQSETKDWGQ